MPSGTGAAVEKLLFKYERKFNIVDYDDVPSEDRENGENCSKIYEPDIMTEQPTPLSKECTFARHSAVNWV